MKTDRPAILKKDFKSVILNNEKKKHLQELCMV